MAHRIHDPNQPSFSNALDELRPELDAISHEQLEPVRLDITAAIITAMGVSPRVKRHRDQIAAELGESAAVNIDRLETTAQACGRAHALHLTTIHGTEVDDMIAELSKTRRVLLLEAQGLVGRNKLPGSILGELVGGTGYQAMCLDVLQLVSALRAEWTAIAGDTPVTSLELDQAEAIANAVARTLGENEQATASSETAELRLRAYTLFVRTYDEVRRAVTFVRWDEGDVDEIVPSLFAGRTRKKDDDDALPIDSIVPIIPIVTAPVVNGSNGTPTTIVAPAGPGMPGAPPFGPS